MKHTLTHRLLSLVLAVFMTVSLMPQMSLHAHAEEQPAPEEAQTTPAPAPQEPSSGAPQADAPVIDLPGAAEAEQPAADPAVEEVQAMIDALVLPAEEDYADADAYEAALAQLEEQLWAIDAAAADLTEEQFVQLDTTNVEVVVDGMNTYWVKKIPMLILEGNGTSDNPYIYDMGIGVTSINGSELKTWVENTVKWTTSRKWYADDKEFTKWGVLTGWSGNSDVTFSAGTYAIYGTTKSSGLSTNHNKDATPKGYIVIKEWVADSADMTLKDGPYSVSVNLKTYSDLTAEKIIAAAVATHNGDVKVEFHHKLEATWGDWHGTSEYLELTSANLSKFVASTDKNSFRLICGNTTADITVTFTESRQKWTISDYTGGTIAYSGDEPLLAAVKAGVSVTGNGTPNVTVTQTGALPATGATAGVTFSVTVPEDDNNLAATKTVTASVTMPASEYTVTVTSEGEGTASVDKTKGPKGTVVTVTATPTTGSSSTKHYLKSITVNGESIEGNTFTLGEEDAAVVVTFGTRSISANAVTVYMNSSKDKKDQYVAKMVPANMDYTLTGEGDQSTVKLQVLAYWGTQRYTDVSNLLDHHCDIGETKTIKLIWPAEGDLPEVSIEGISVTVLDSHRTITYMDGTETKSTAGTERLTTATTAAALTKDGYTFKSWNTAADGSGTSYAAGAPIQIGEDNVILYAQWTVNSYTITWDANDGTFADGSTTKTTTVAYGETPVAPTEEPSQDGTAFAGWGEITPVTGDTTYTAVWANDKNDNDVDDAKETATVQVNIEGPGTVALSGGIITDNGNGNYTVLYDSKAEGGNVITVTAAPKDTVNTDGSVDYLISAPTSVTVTNGQTATVEAEFGTESITIHKSGNVYVNASLTGGDKLKDLKSKVLTAAGINTDEAANYTVYMVVGKLIGDGVEHIDVDTSNSGDRINMYTRFNVGDSQSFIVQKDGDHVVSDTITVKVVDSRLILDITASEETIEFSGKTEVEGIKEDVKGLFTITTTDPATGDVTNVSVSDSYVTWSPAYAWPEDAQTKTFTVTAKVNAIANGDYQNAPSASVTVTLVDTTILYTVTYLDGYKPEGNVVAEYTIAENLATQKPNDPTREYYTFAGWTPAVAEIVTENATYTAQWTAVKDNNKNGIADQEEIYTVIYRFNDGVTADKTIENLVWDSTGHKIEDPTREGYTFAGWTPIVGATVAAPESGTVITYNAGWTKDHVVTFVNEGVETKQVVQDGETVAEPTAPVWDDDHDFLGWYNGDVAYDFNTTVTENLTLTAKWRVDFNHNDIEDSEEAHFTVIYDVDGALTTHENVLVGLDTPAMADPAKTGYKFNGWQPAVAETVTDNVTYVAQWLDDANNNGVDDAEETITFAITGDGAVTVNGQTVTAEANTYLYDSEVDKTITIKAVPSTTGGILTETISASYVKSIVVGETAAKLDYVAEYAVTYTFTANGSQKVVVEFAEAEFVYNDERLMNYYPGMKDVKNETVYNAIVKTPELGTGVFSIQYKAREAMSQKVNLLNIVGDNDILKTALETMKLDTIDIDMPVLWQDVNVETDEGLIKDSVSLDQAVAENLKAEDIEALWNTFDTAVKENGGYVSLTGIPAGTKAVEAEINKLIETIKNAAMYYEAHNFGYNPTDAETVTEVIKITYGNEALYIEGESDIQLKDLRATSYLKGNNVSLMYKDYTDEDLLELVAPYIVNAAGETVEGALTALDITDPYTFEGKVVSDTAYELKVKFAGDEIYKPSEATFQVTITKASAEMNLTGMVVTYGEEYHPLNESTITVGNKYGSYTDITESVIEFVLGLDVADMDMDKDGIKGLNGKVQLILPADLQNMLDGILGALGGSVEEGVELSLSDLAKYLEPIQDSSVEFLKQALEAIQGITETADIKVTLGGSLPTDTGAYLYGAVSTNSNYETAYGVTYIIIKPNTERVYLDWNYKDTNNVFSWALLEYVDLGASAYAEETFATKNDEATDLIHNLIFGFVPDLTVAEGEVPVKFVIQLDGVSDIVDATKPEPTPDESKLQNGAFLQVGFIAEFGNEMYYAVPIVRPLIIIPNVANVKFEDQNDNNLFHFTFDNTEKGVEVTVTDGEGRPMDLSGLTVTYTGLQTNTKTYHSTELPTHAGAYLVTAIYVDKNDSGEITAVGASAAVMVIEPAKSAVEVTSDLYIYNGTRHFLADQFKATGAAGLTPDTTVISAEIADVGNVKEDGWEAVSRNLNVDFPVWVDTLLKAEVPDVYQNGITAGEFADKIVGKLPDLLAKLEELEISGDLATKAATALTDALKQVSDVIAKVDADAKLTFYDNEYAQNVGVYLYTVIVTDSDHYPSAGTGFVVVAPSVQNTYLKFNFDNPAELWPVSLIQGNDMGATAYTDETHTVVNETATKKVVTKFLTIDVKDGKLIALDEKPSVEGVYIQVAYIPPEMSATMTFSDLIARALIVAPETAKVEFLDGNGQVNPDRKFVFDDQPKAMDSVRVTDLKTGEELTGGQLTITYVGVCTDGTVYNSTEAPKNAGIYSVIALYQERSNVEGAQNKLDKIGVGVGVMAIEPTEATVQVSDANYVVQSGKSYPVRDFTVAASSVEGVTPEVTYITAQIAVTDNLSLHGLKGVSERLNIDFPVWVDELLLKYIPEYQNAYENGIKAAEFAAMIESKLPDLTATLNELGVKKEAIDTLEAAMNKVIGVLNNENIAENASLGFKDNLSCSEVGIYVNTSIVTDPNHYPAVDSGIVLIVPEVNQHYLKFDYEDANHLWTNKLLQEELLKASAYTDKTYVQLDDEATAKIDYKYLTVDPATGELKIASLSELTTGVYVQLAYIPLVLDGKIDVSDLIGRIMVVVPDLMDVTLSGGPFTYDGQPKAMTAVIKDNEGVVVDYDVKDLYLYYVGIEGDFETYTSTNAPTMAGAYAVAALYVGKDASGMPVALGADVATMIINKTDTVFELKPTEVVYTGEGQMNETVNDHNVGYLYLTMNSDLENLVVTVDVTDGLKAQLERLPQVVQDAVSEVLKLTEGDVRVSTLMDTFEKVLGELEQLQAEMPASVPASLVEFFDKVLTKLEELKTSVTDKIPEEMIENGVVVYGKPVNVGSYVTFALIISENFNSVFANSTLKINCVPEHQFGEWVVLIEATCTEDGEREHICQIPGCGHVASEEIPALGHAYVGEETTPATCTEKGVMTYTCQNECCPEETKTYTEEIDALGHDYQAVVTAPTCTAEGYTTNICSRCGDNQKVEGSETAMIPHSYTMVETLPTCEAAGYYTYTCSCGEHYTHEGKPATGHDLDEGVVTTAPTCTATGILTKTCKTCGDKIEESIAATGHSYDGGAVTTPATCTTAGVMTYTCKQGDHSYTETIPATGHNYQSVVTTPTCTEQGYTTHTCGNCDDSYVDTYVAATGHSWDEGEEITSSDPDEVMKKYTCTKCGETEDRVVHTHSYNTVVTAPTCTEQGYTTYTCKDKDCDYSYQADYVAALGHDLSVLKSDADGHWYQCSRCDVTGAKDAHTGGMATCTEQAKCSICQTAYGQAKGHSYEWMADDNQHWQNCTACSHETTKATHSGGTATCTEQAVCTTCQKEYGVLRKHDYTNATPSFVWVGVTQCTAYFPCAYEDCEHLQSVECVTITDKITTEPTCTTKGVRTYTATATHPASGAFVYGYATEEIPATGHSYVSVITAPTCTEQGYTTHTCSVCDHSYVDTYVVATGEHTWDAGVETTPPTAPGGGVITYTCTVCQATKTQQTDHQHSFIADEVTAPTCTEQGYTTYTCTCGESEQKDFVPATDHNNSGSWQTDSSDHWKVCANANCEEVLDRVAHFGGTATCTEQAKCSVCGVAYGKEDLTNHNFSSAWSSNDQQHYHQCSRCDASTDAADHSYDNACDTTCDTCGHVRVITHDYQLWYSDSEHWYQCSVCNDVQANSREAHKGGTATCTAAAVCSVCNIAYGAKADHVYGVKQYDETNHWTKCNSCDATTEHVKHSGGTATCTQQAVCTGCGVAYGEKAEHTYCDQWKSDENKHWHECSCGDKTDLAAHIPGAAATETTAQTCTTCGYVIAPALDHQHNYTQVEKVEWLTFTEAKVTLKCTCGETKTEDRTVTQSTDVSGGEGKGEVDLTIEGVSGAVGTTAITVEVVEEGTGTGKMRMRVALPPVQEIQEKTMLMYIGSYDENGRMIDCQIVTWDEIQQKSFALDLTTSDELGIHFLTPGSLAPMTQSLHIHE